VVGFVIIDAIYEYLMGHEILKGLGASGYASQLCIEWTTRRILLYKGKFLPPVIYFIYLQEDKAVLSCFDITAESFPYCDPEFPDNLLAAIK